MDEEVNKLISEGNKKQILKDNILNALKYYDSVSDIKSCKSILDYYINSQQDYNNMIPYSCKYLEKETATTIKDVFNNIYNFINQGNTECIVPFLNKNMKWVLIFYNEEIDTYNYSKINEYIMWILDKISYFENTEEHVKYTLIQTCHRYLEELKKDSNRFMRFLSVDNTKLYEENAHLLISKLSKSS